MILGHMQQRIVDCDTTGDSFIEHALDVVVKIAEVVKRQRPWSRIDVGNGLIEIVIGNQWQNRPEDFLMHDAHVVVDVGDQGRRYFLRTFQRFVGGRDRQHHRTTCSGVVQITIEPVNVTGADDAGVIGVLRERRVEPRHDTLRCGRERLLLGPRQQHIVRRNAGLAGIETFAEENLLGGLVDLAFRSDDGRRFAA